MSKLAHSNQETMDQIEAQAIADEEAGKPNDPVRRQPLRCYESIIDVLLTQLEDTDHE